ncbi:porin [Kaarinaea lacus]
MKMRHILISLAIAAVTGAAFITPARAEVTAYGIAQVEVAAVSWQQETVGGCENSNQPVFDGTNKCDGVDILDNAQGRVGLKAAEDLGNGMTGLAKFEFKADTSDNTTSGSNISLTARESLVGLKAGWGQLELGNLKSAYKYYGGVKYDPFVSTTLEARGNGGMSGSSSYGKSSALGTGGPIPNVSNAYGHNGFLKQMLGYEYTGGPVQVRVTYSIADGRGDYSGGLMFKQDKFEVFAALVSTGDTLDDGDSESYESWKLGGAFKIGAHKFMAQYEQHSYSITNANDVEPTHMFLGWNMKIGKNIFVVQGGQFDSDDSTSPNADTTYATLGVIHNFTKTTRVFGGYRMSDADDDSKEDVISIGLRKDF